MKCPKWISTSAESSTGSRISSLSANRMRLRKPLEWLVLLPALLFGRYFLPILVILFSLFINVRMGLYIALCWWAFPRSFTVA